jgi:amino acid adenylation domain-containing protein
MQRLRADHTSVKNEQSIVAGFESRVERNSEGLAVRHSNRSISYGELNRAANRLARAVLAACPGVQPVVAGVFPPGERGIIALLAVLKTGKIYLPLDASAPAARLCGILTEAQAALLLSDGEHALSDEPPCPILNIREAEKQSDDNLGLKIAAEAPACIIYTSGSTGRPKGVVHLHRNLLHNVRNHTEGYGITEKDRILPNGLADLLTALMNGASLFPFSWKADGLLALKERLLEDRITIWTAVPTTLRRFAGALSGEERFPHLRLIKLSGETIYSHDVELCRKYFSKSCVLRPALAMTEAGMVCAHFIRAETEVAEGVVPVGYPVGGKEILFLGEDGRSADDGAVGEIAIRSRFLPAGYWRRPDLTAARFLTDPEGGDRRIYLTGDLGRRRPDGLIEHLGRRDSQVKIRGNRVDLTEVEAALQGLEGVSQAAVLALPDGDGQTALFGYFTASRELSPTLLRRQLRRRLPDCMIPAGLLGLDQMPLLPNGKVDRRALAQTVPEPMEEPTPTDPPRTAMEQALARVWCELLGLRAVGRGDNFFDLSGNSLLAIEVAARMEKLTGVRVSAVATASQTLMQWAATYDPVPETRSDSAAAPETAGMQPFFLGPTDRQLWCVYHAPEPRTSPRGGVVLCQPFGWEYYTCHHCCRSLAKQLAQAGFAVLRFDYFGTGDSSGACEEGQVEIWLDNIRAAVQELERRGHACRALVGLRFGATMAALFGAARGGLPAMVLWEPVSDGDRHLKDLQLKQEEDLRGAEVFPDELLGLAAAPELRAGIRSSRFENLEGNAAEQILLLESDRAGGPDLAASLRRTSARLCREDPAEPAFWNVRGNTQALAPRTVSRIVAWMEQTCR